ncbi:MAG: hypothetical protein R2730_00695 [Chitinophagales bacterium]
MNKIFFALTVIVLLLMACDDETTIDVGAPVIEFILPTASTGGEYFTDTNNVVLIKANITDEDELHNIELSVFNTYDHGNGATEEMWRMNMHSHGNFYAIDTSYVIDTACHSNYYFKVMASDHNDNVSRDSVLIYVHGKKGSMPLCN